jgi:hypothetical protein
VELFAVLIIAELRVKVVVDDLDRPLGVLKLHLLLVVALTGNMLLAFPLAGRCAIMVGLLLLLLAELLRELLDLPTLLGAVGPGVVHRALRPALIATKRLAWLLVGHYCDSGGSGSTYQRLVVVGLFLLPILILATALSNGICFGLAGLPYPRSRLGVPRMPFHSPGALVRQVEELRDVFQLVGGQLLEHLLISHTLSKSDNNRSIGDVGDSVSNLGEPLDEGRQCLPWALLHSVEVDLVARVSVGALEVDRELTAQLRPGGEGPLG